MPTFNIYPESGTYGRTIKVTIDIDGELFSGDKTLELKWSNGSTTNQEMFTGLDVNSEGVVRVSFYYAQENTYELEVTLTDVSDGQSINLGSKFRTYVIDVAGDGNRADIDNDGLPDIVEVAVGLDPFEKDWNRDSDGDGWSDFDVWLRDIDPKYLDSQGVPRDTDRDGWSDFDEEQLRDTNHLDLISSLPSNPNGFESGSTAYTKALNRYQDVPGATSLYEVEYNLSASVSNMAVPSNGASVVRTKAEIRTVSGDSVFDPQNLLTALELSELSSEQQSQLPQRLIKSHYEQSVDVGDIRYLRIPAGNSLVFSVDEERHFSGADSGDSEENKIYRLKTWLPKQGSLSPLTFESDSATWATADEWRTAFIDYLKLHLLVSKSIGINQEETITTAFVEFLVAQEMSLLSLGQRFVFNSLREHNPTLDYMEAQLNLLHQSTLDDAVARMNTLKSTRLLYQYGLAADYLEALPGNHVSDEFLQQMLLSVFAVDSDEAYQIRLMLLNDAAEEIEMDSTIADPYEDSDGDGILNMQEIMQPIISMTAPWNHDTDGDGYNDANDLCALDAANRCNPNVPVLWVDGSLQAQESDDINNGFIVLTLQLNAPATELVSLDYLVTSIDGDTAELNIDYVGMGGTAIFMPGQQAFVIQIPLNSDNEEEGSENFHLLLSNPTGVMVQSYQYELGILDEDTEVLSSDASLASIGGINLSPSFSSTTYTYTATIPADQTHVQLSAITSDDGATMTLNGGPVLSGFSYTLAMSSGDNPITYHVQSEDGNSTSTYQVVITKELPVSPYIELNELNGANGGWINGNELNHYLGFSISSVGDFNGDGFEDFAIGAPNKSTGFSLAGEAYVVFGKPSGLDLSVPITDLMDGVKGFRIYTTYPYGYTGLGNAISHGDFNNDGLSDVLISARNYDGTAIGRVIVIYGKTDWLAEGIDVETMNSNDGFYFKGFYDSSISARINNAENAGDVNGDGIDDIAIAASTYTDAVHSGYVGRVYIAYGKENWGDVEHLITEVEGENGFHITGLSQKEAVLRVYSAGDVNNDGFDDVLVSGRKDIGELLGSSFLFYGGQGLANMDINHAGVTFRDSAGDIEVARGNLDFNNDGFSDLVFGVYNRDSSQGDANAGAAYLVYGGAFSTDVFELSNITPEQGFLVEGEHSGDLLGRRLSGQVGDFNGDGFDDVFFDTDSTGDQEEDRARGYLFFGTDEVIQSPYQLSELSPDRGIAFRGGKYSSVANIFASGLGDINGDGFDDLGITLPRESVNGVENSGQISVIYGFQNQ